MDKIVENVMAKYRQRSEVGIAKYGTTLDENKATLIEWLTHLQEELMDATLYIEKLKSDLNEK
jgi:tRNA A37 threonylcarbamoyladenosine biosynthesis protein TsaE